MGGRSQIAVLAAAALLAAPAAAQEVRPPPRPATLSMPDLPDTRPPPRPEGWARLTRPAAPGWAIALACEGRAAPRACRGVLARTPPSAVGYPVAALCALLPPGGPAREAPCAGEEAVTPDGIEMRWRLQGGGAVLIGPGGEVDGVPAARVGAFCRRTEADLFFCRFPAPGDA
ncbi:MAG: hypothetical protein ACU0BS_03490 [Hasllibacter sp.]